MTFVISWPFLYRCNLLGQSRLPTVLLDMSTEDSILSQQNEITKLSSWIEVSLFTELNQTKVPL